MAVIKPFVTVMAVTDDEHAACVAPFVPLTLTAPSSRVTPLFQSAYLLVPVAGSASITTFAQLVAVPELSVQVMVLKCPPASVVAVEDEFGRLIVPPKSC